MMASACVNNPATDHAFGWLSPRVSFSRDSDPNPKPAKSSPVLVDPVVSDPDFIDFEFRLHDPVDAMLPADELFSGGKLVPLHLSKPPPPPPAAAAAAPAAPLKPSRRDELIGSASASDVFAVSPKAPTCTSRWRELLRIKKQQQQRRQSNNPKADPGGKNTNPNPTRSSALKQFLHRRSSLTDPSLGGHAPLRESEAEALSRLSLSSSTSSDTNDFPRLSLDSDLKPNPHPILLNRNPPRARLSSAGGGGGRVGRSPARRPAEAPPPARCASVDSPRMNASGRVVFQGLGRSSSSPSTFNGGPNSAAAAARNKYKGMERSYSANVRVINVPVPSKAGSVFGFLGPKNAAAAAAAGGGGNRGKKIRDDMILSHY